MEIAGRRILVTGASRGIGRALAEALAVEGARLALLARSELTLREVADRLGARFYPVDLGEPDATRGLIDRIEEDGGPLDVLVNNAGVSHVRWALDNTEEEIENLVRINLLSPMLLCRQLIPRMIERGAGHIVNVSSLAGVLSPPGLVHYGATKAALSHYTAGLRQDLRGLPIDLTLVELGSVPTELDALSRRHGPLRALVERAARADGSARDMTPIPVVVGAIVEAIRSGKRHVRLPRQAVPLCMLVEAPRRLTEWVFRRVDPRA